MFISVFDSSVSSLSFESVLLCMAAAIVLGIFIAFVYMKGGSAHYTKSFVITVACLPVLVEAIVLMTSGSLGTAIAVAGAFSLVRFRSAPGTSREILAIFFAMAVGLACGMGEIAFAALLTAVVSAVFFILMKSGFGGSAGADKDLRITIPENLDYTEIFDDLFARYTTKARLEKVKTVNLGSMYELDYSISLKDPKEEKKLIDEIRVRNGNLTVVCGRHAELPTEL